MTKCPEERSYHTIIVIMIVLLLSNRGSSDPESSSVDVITSRPSERKADVIFHVFIPSKVWGWTKKSIVCLAFGHIDLGNWKTTPSGDFVNKR